VVGHEHISEDSDYAECVSESLHPRGNYQEYLSQAGKNNYMMNYHVADFTTRIKNAYAARRKSVQMPYSKITKAIAEVLIKEQFLASVAEEENDGKKVITVSLRYVNRRPSVHDIRIVSKPSLRVYRSMKAMQSDPQKNAMVSVISTSQGIMSGKEAQKKGVGGELLFKIW
jgi:small subunit ribosomal protein S8